jgi:hypothetical protein
MDVDGTTVALVVTLIAFFGPIVFVVVRLVGPPPPAPRFNAAELQDVADRLRQRRPAAQDADDTCVVCLAPFARPVEALPCGHVFCSDCVVALIAAPAFTGTCPTCRSPMQLLAPCFRRYDTSPQRIADEFDDALRRFNAARRNPLTAGGVAAGVNFAAYNFWNLPLRVRIRIITIVIVVACYVASPFDLVSEAAYGALGLVDDALLLLGAAVLLFFLLSRLFGA